MSRSVSRYRRSLACLAALLCTQAAVALHYTFDEDYFQADLPIFGQGLSGGQFRGVDSMQFSIQPRLGREGSRALVVRDMDRDFKGVTLTPSREALGQDFDPASSKVEFAFSYRQTEIGGKGICMRIMLADDAVRFELTNDGRIFALDGARHPAKTYVESRVFTPEVGQWVQVRGVLDYGKQTFTAAINGAPLNQGGQMVFRRDTPEAGKALTLVFLAMEQQVPDWAEIHFDDIELRLLPTQ
jgi:hypothetical protein